MRTSVTAALVIGLGCLTLAQQTFDSADIYVRAHSSTTNVTGGVVRAGRYDLRNATMVDLIADGYGVQPESIVGGPSWLELTRYDIAAKVPDGSSREQLSAMLRALLAERFGLTLHQDVRAVSAFALTPGSGKAKMKPAVEGDQHGCDLAPQPAAPGAVPSTHMVCRNVTMPAFVEALRSYAGAGYLPNPLVDRTNIQGTWDVELEWTPRASLALAGTYGVALFDAVDRQLGLRIAPQTIPTQVLVVDAVNQQPRPNPLGTATNVPALPPAEFDVADIKMSPHGSRPGPWRMLQGGRFDMQNQSMRGLVNLAWRITDDQQIVGAPSWFTTNLYSISAVASTAVNGTRDDIQIDFDDLRGMLRDLITKRFKLASHMEDRPVNAYTLVADKPKLQAADPADRTKCQQVLSPTGSPAGTRTIACQNMTMAQFADALQPLVPGYLHMPVADETTLTGAWNFSFMFTPAPPANGPNGAAAPANASAASDPSGAVTLFDALGKLGLKLEMRKRPMSVLVIDHIDEKPTDN